MLVWVFMCFALLIEFNIRLVIVNVLDLLLLFDYYFAWWVVLKLCRFDLGVLIWFALWLC